MSQTIEAAKDGIKISYLRFISDSTPGYICLFFFGIVFYNKLPLPFIGTSWISIIPSSLDTEVKVILLAILFLLATPIGLSLNALGWFLLGAPQVYFVRFWHSIPIMPVPFIAPSRRAMCSKDVDNFIELTSIPFECLKNIYEKSKFFEQLITIYLPSAYQRFEHIRGLKRLLRSLSLLCFAISIYFVITIWAPIKAIYSLGIGVFFLLFCSLIEYYQCLFVNFVVFTCCSQHDAKTVTFQEAINYVCAQQNEFSRAQKPSAR